MKTKSKGIIWDIKKYAIHDGPGIRSTVFFKGCPLSCWWCHNPEGQNPRLEKFDQKYTSSTTQEEIVGREVSVEEVIAEIEKDLIFYDQSGGGVTFSGGEPLMQPQFLGALLDACREREFTTTLDTSGYASWEVMKKVKDKINLFLYDIKLIDPEKHQKFTGVSNEAILSNFKGLDNEGKNIIIRFPVIPGITDTEEEINLLENWLGDLVTVKEINLLPYHKIGKGKYERMNLTNRLPDLEPPSTERIDHLKGKLREIGFEVKVGG